MRAPAFSVNLAALKISRSLSHLDSAKFVNLQLKYIYIDYSDKD